MEEKKYYHAYEQRYARVYSTGARYWNEHEPSRALQRFLEGYGVVPCPTLELGCGEGFETRYLAGRGFDVLAVDLSPTVVEKCSAAAREAGLSIDCRIGDITRLPFLPDGAFSLVVAIGSYHMLNDPEDRRNCLREARRLLAPEGLLFLQNGLNLRQAETYFPEDREKITVFREVRRGASVTRELKTGEGSTSVTVPVTPKTFFGTLEQFEEEVRLAGLEVLEAYPTNEDAINAGWEAVVIGRKGEDPDF